jgi:Holliday junction DNA helicase RuvA
MISKLTGRIDELKPTSIILDINGVGYGLTIPVSTFDKIQNLAETSLYVFTLHKEDQFKLFGFATMKEKFLFNILLGVNGIGPSMAISIISSITAERITEAVKSENSGLLLKVPGVGKSKAEKLIFELKRKVSLLDEISDPSEETISPSRDAVDALVALGFDELKAKKCVNEIIKEKKDSGVEEIIKESLKILV